MFSIGLRRKVLCGGLVLGTTIGTGQAALAQAGDAGEGSLDAPALDEGIVPTDDSLPLLTNRRVYMDGRQVEFGDGTEAAAKASVSVTKPRVPQKLKVLLTSLDKKESVSLSSAGGILAFLKNLFQTIMAKIFVWNGKRFSVAKILVDVRSIQVQPADGSGAWVTVRDFGPAGEVMDLAELQTGTYLELGLSDLPPGTYQRVRLNLGDDNALEVDEGKGLVMRPLATLARGDERIDLVSRFTIAGSGLTTLKIEFNAQQSILRMPDGRYYIKPSFRIISAETAPGVSRTIDAGGGTVMILGEVSLTVPAGALARATTVTVTPSYRLGTHKSEAGLWAFPYEYVVDASGAAFTKPATLAVTYPNVYVAAMGLEAGSLALASFDAAGAAWKSLPTTAGKDGTLSAYVSKGGRYVPVGRSQGPVAAGACTDLDDSGALANRRMGVDFRFFDAACGRLDACYRYGLITYGRDAAACQSAFGAQAAARCDDLCRSGDLSGRACAELSDDDWAAMPFGADLREMVATCRDAGQALVADAVAHAGERYPAESAMACDDYEGLGVSCAAPTCDVTVDRAEVTADIPQDLVFQVHVRGSVTHVDFDGTPAYRGQGLPLPIDDVITVRDNGRVLSQDRVFTAQVYGPGTGAGPVTCQTTVRAKMPIPPCGLVVTPDVIHNGESPVVTLSAGPGYNLAYLDLRGPNQYNQVGLGVPNADGVRQFKSIARPTFSRVFTARVYDDLGAEKTCTASVTVLP